MLVVWHALILGLEVFVHILPEKAYCRRLWRPILASEVDEDRNSMIKTLEASITDQPEQLDKMKTIINDWADMKIKSFKDRRSWVRNPDEVN